MADLSFKLSRAVARGRADKGVPRNRAQILLGLLRMRAQAHRLGMDDHEQKLRDQITWSLPMEDGEAPEDRVEADVAPPVTPAS